LILLRRAGKDEEERREREREQEKREREQGEELVNMRPKSSKSGKAVRQQRRIRRTKVKPSS